MPATTNAADRFKLRETSAQPIWYFRLCAVSCEAGGMASEMDGVAGDDVCVDGIVDTRLVFVWRHDVYGQPRYTFNIT